MTSSALPNTKTVLIADDTAFVRDRFASALEEAGHRTLTAQNGGEMLTLLRKHLSTIDLLVLDLRLPQASGADAVRHIREVADDRLPILIFSGTVSNADEVRRLAALGVDGYVNEYAAVTHIVPSLTPHLFPESYNRRGSPRVVLGIPTAYSFEKTVGAALTLNLGRGGMAIRTTSPFELDTNVRLRFRLAGLPQDIDAPARVRWTRKRLGMGLQFRGLSPADQTAVDAFVDTHFFQPRRA